LNLRIGVTMRYLRPWRAGGRAARAHRYLCVIDPDRLDPDHLPRELAVSALTMAGQDAQQFHNGVTGNALKPLCSKAVVDARDESGTDPTIIDVVLRWLDARVCSLNDWSGGSGALSAVLISGSFSRVTPRWSRARDEWVSGKTSPLTLRRLPAV
jgi:hypothetical protein